MASEHKNPGRPTGLAVDLALLRSLRHELELSQEALAELAGLSVRTVQNTERGRPVSAETVRALANALRVPRATLLVPSPDELHERLLARGLAPPPPPPLWIARPDALSAAHQHLLAAHTPRLCALGGPPGIGKSALAAVVAAELAEHFERGVVWVSAHHVRRAEGVEQIQTEIATALGFAERLAAHRDPETRRHAFQTSFWRPGRRLLVLDDVADIALVDAFCEPTSSAQTAVLLTSHRRAVLDALAPGSVVALDSLSLPRARELLGSGYALTDRLDADPAGARQLLELLDGSPRGLHIVGRLLRRERYTTPGEFAERARHDAAQLRNVAELRATHDPVERRDVHLLLPWLQLERHLEPRCWQLFVSMAVFGECAFGARWALALHGLDPDDDEARALLAPLRELSLVHERSQPPGATDAEPLLHLDTQAAMAARHCCGDALGRWQRGLLALARAEARRLGEQPVPARVAGFLAWRDLFGHCVELAVGALGAAPPELHTLAPDAPRHPLDDDSLAAHLPALVVALAPVLVAHDVPEAGTWLAAAASLGDPVERGELAAAIGVWLARRMAFEAASTWLALAPAPMHPGRPPAPHREHPLASAEQRVASAVAWRPGDDRQPAGAVLQWLARAFDGRVLAGHGLVLDAAALPHERARLAVRLAEGLACSAGPRLVATGPCQTGHDPSGPLVDRVEQRLGAMADDDDEVWLDATTARLLGQRVGTERWLALSALPSRALPASSPLLGRDVELARLLADFEVAVGGRATARLITGTAGIGKTRLASALVETLRGRHERVTVLGGRTEALHGGYPYALLGDMLRTATGTARGERDEADWQRWQTRLGRHLESAEAAAWVAAFLGELAGVTRPPAESHPRLRAARGDTLLMREQLRAAWLAWLEAECRAQPVVLLLDDVHQADTASLTLLELARRRLADLPLLLIATSRTATQALPGSPLWRDDEHLALGPLTVDAGRALLEQHAPQAGWTSGFVDGLLGQAEGHPLLLEELVRCALAGDATRRPDDALRPDHAVLGIMQARHANLGAELRRVLRVASVLGARFETDALQAVLTSGEVGVFGAPGAVGGPMEALCSHDILTRRPATEAHREGYAFRHGLMREAAYAMLTDADRREAHRRCARWFETRSDQPPIVVAEHYERGALPQHAAGWFLRAAEAALRLDDDATARASAERGLACQPEQPSLVGALQVVRAEALRGLGEHREAGATIAALVDLPEPGSALWYRALRLTWTVRERGEYAERWRQLLEVEPAPEAEARAEAVVTLSRAAANMDPEGLSDAAAALLERAEALMDTLGDEAPLVRAWLCQTQALRHGARGEHDRAVVRFEEGAALAHEAGSERIYVGCRSEMGFSCMQLGQHERAVELLEEGTERSLRAERLGSAAFARVCLGASLLALERLDEAAETLEQALAWCLDNEDTYLEGHCRRFLAQLERTRSRLDHAEAHARRALVCAEATPSMRPGVVAELAATLLDTGRADDARTLVEDAHAELVAGDTVALGLPELMAVRIRVLRTCGDPAAARQACAEAHALVAELAARVADEAARDTMLERVPALRAIRALDDGESP